MPLSLKLDNRAFRARPDIDLRTAARMLVATGIIVGLVGLAWASAAQSLSARSSVNVQNAVAITHDRFVRSGAPSTFEVRIAEPKGRTVTIALDGRGSGTAITSTFPAPASISVTDGVQRIAFTSRPTGDMVFKVTVVPTSWGNNALRLQLGIGSDVSVETPLNVFVTP